MSFHPEVESSADEVLSGGAARARLSLAFFTRVVRGERRVSRARLEALQEGEAVPTHKHEESALEAWNRFLSGEADPKEKFALTLVRYAA